HTAISGIHTQECGLAGEICWAKKEKNSWTRMIETGLGCMIGCASLLGRQAVLAGRPRSNSRPSALRSLQLTATAMVALRQLKRFRSRAGQPWPWNAMSPRPRVFLWRRPGGWLLLAVGRSDQQCGRTPPGTVGGTLTGGLECSGANQLNRILLVHAGFRPGHARKGFGRASAYCLDRCGATSRDERRLQCEQGRGSDAFSSARF